jgi:tetraacyldisaccharide 4'-kinase
MRAPEFWRRPPGIAAALLSPLSATWTAAARRRQFSASPYRAPVPVICVGNLVVGGAGKTPVVLALAELLATRGIAAHIVSRGYGGRLAGPLLVDPAVHDACAVGDEPLMLAAFAPCWVARDRAAGVRAAVDGGADAVVLDDGFQNPTVAKDLALLVIDAEYGFGNGRVMPAGPLREPAARGIRRADAVVLIGDGAAPATVRAAPCPVLRARLEPIDGERFASAPVVAFAGIGRPEKVFAALRALGAVVVSAHPFADHHRFSAREITRLKATAMRSDARLVTTAKDWVRLPPAWRSGVEVIEVRLRWQDPAAVMRLLASVLRAGDGHGRSAARR